MRRFYPDKTLEQLFQGAIRVLSTLGLVVQNRTCLELLEKFGAKIDFSQERAIFSKEMIERVLKIVRAENSVIDKKPIMPPHIEYGSGGTCPFYYDDSQGDAHIAEERDLIEACKIIETSGVANSVTPVYPSGYSPKFIAIRGIQVAIETFRNTICMGSDLFFPEQIPFAVELGKLYRNDPRWFLPAGNCPTSPLKIGHLIAELALLKARYNVRYAVPVMPISGIGSPITPLGTAVVGIAEILGSYAFAKALNIETPVSAVSLTSKLDMKTGCVTFVAPEVFAADLAIVETFKFYLNLPCQTWAVYIDAKKPGMQSTYERLTRTLGLALYDVFTQSLEGTLSQGKVFSATQLMIDKEIHKFFATYTADTTITGDSMAIDEIINIGFDTNRYMEHEHTLRNMRTSWSPDLLLNHKQISEKLCLENAQEIWKHNLSKYESPAHSKEFLNELNRICNAARKVLE